MSRGSLLAGTTVLRGNVTDLHTLWSERLPVELRYWDAWLKSEGRQWADDPDAAAAEFRARFDPTTPLQPRLGELIDNRDSDTLRILDVGAGPVTLVGYTWPGWKVRIDAIDPLAAEYGQLLHRHGLRAPVHTWQADGEQVGALFPG